MKPYVFAKTAEADLEAIYAYIAEDNPVVARRVIMEIREAARRLARLPHLGHTRKDLTDQSVRFWPVYSYLVVYRPDTKPLEIARVLSGYRDLASLFQNP
jgi:plasmid stabilization system protein ParE